MIYRDSDYISFKDTSTLNACISEFGSDNHLTYKQAADVSTLYKWVYEGMQPGYEVAIFRQRLPYYSLMDGTTSNYDFTEFQYFTGLTTIESEAFRETGMRSIIIPESVTTIESSAFYYAQSLEFIKLPAGLTSIGYDAFAGCSNLKVFILEGTIPPVLYNNCIPYGCSIIVPVGYGNVYRTDSNWSVYASMIKEINE